MSLNSKWTPMRWRCGPLDAARLAASNKADAAASTSGLKTANQWADPAMLQILDGTPVNCLIVDWATGGEADAVQQKALQPLIDAGKRKGIGFVGAVIATDGLPAIAAAGKAAGLEALLLSGPAPGELPLPVISTFARDSADWDRVTETFVLTGNVWPGAVARAYSQSAATDAASAGPTRDPWVNSNGWVSLLVRGVAPGKRLWLDIPLPDAKEKLTAEQYCLAVADSRAHGCRWIIDLDDTMRSALAVEEPKAAASWKKIAQMEAFFESHEKWDATQPIGVLTVVSDFRGDNLSMSGEVLNLLKRQQIPFTVQDRKRPLAGAMSGKLAILWVDDAEPSEQQHRQLLAFVEQGGLVIASKYWGPKSIASHREDWLFDYDIYPIGKGRIVAASSGFSDPFVVGRDAHLIVGREHDPLRLFNSGTTTCYTSIDPTGRTELVQIMNYGAPKPVEFVSLWVKGNASTAQLLSADKSASLKSTAESDGATFDIPPVVAYYAVEIERKA